MTAKGEVLDAEAAANRGYDGLFGWMRKAEAVWNEHRSTESGFAQQLNHYGKLSVQFPLATLRVVYAKAGTQPTAGVLHSGSQLIDHMLYWCAPPTEQEAAFLAAFLNSETMRVRAEQFQARGQWGARHFDKVMFNLPIPRFDAADPLHLDLAAAAGEAEALAAVVPLPESVKFQRARKLVRDALADAGLSQRIDALVVRLLDGT